MSTAEGVGKVKIDRLTVSGVFKGKRCLREVKLLHLHSDGPTDHVCMVFLTIVPDSRNIFNVVVVTYHFAQAVATKDQKASTIAKVLWEQYFVHYGQST